MYLAKPPPFAPGIPPGAKEIPLGLTLSVSRVFEAGRPYDPGLVQYFADLAKLYGLRHRDDYFTRVHRNTFTELIQGALDGLGALDDPVDLVVLAHSTPDAEPGWPACYLADALPGDPLALAVSDQGVTAAFTALRIVADYSTVDDFRRAIVVLLDQTTLMNDEHPPAGIALPEQDSVVALVLDRKPGAGRLTVRQLTDVGAPEAGATVAELLRERALPVAVLGPDLAAATEAPPDAEIVAVAPGRPCSGTWAHFLEHRQTGRSMVIADYDPALRYLGICTVDFPGGDGPP
ncbi:hypothetical protein [Amycolatopsis anabasis]|uniref:hypothetical protein n=1 Tax=Amycolatopsis anabasis TaxID=1840409 RepID=UPI00131E88BD|nr:hypothetical protein [Amycolatopsis anabasis]